MKVVINICYGGFAVSEKVYEKLGLEWDGFGVLYDYRDKFKDTISFRSCPELIKAIEEVGIEEASGYLAKLKIIEIPDDVDAYISDYDGWETVEEKHRSWD